MRFGRNWECLEVLYNYSPSRQLGPVEIRVGHQALFR